MRKRYIDELRWMDVLLLIPYHAAMAWNCWNEPNYVFFGSSRALSSIVVFLSPYFMPLLFLLAGMSTKYSLTRRTGRQYITERVKRLLVPLVFGVLVFMPAMTYLADRRSGGWEGGFFDHYRIFFTRFTDLTGADGGFSLGQFWFLLYLFVISLIALGVITLQKRSLPQLRCRLPFRGVCLLGLPLPLLSEVLSGGGKSLAEYTYLFLLGYYVFSEDEVMDKAERFAPLTAAVGLAAGAVNVYLFIWQGGHPGLNTAAKYLCEWAMLLGLPGLCKRHPCPSAAVSDYMSRRSFPFFGFHFVWLVLFQYALAGPLGDSTVLLFLIPVLLAYSASFTCCEVCLRLPWLSFLMGTKPLK